MKKDAVSKELLHLLVRVYNRSIQYYYYFPDVIICGHHRLERSEFESLLTQELITSYHADSFGRMYRLTQKAERMLQLQLRRRHRSYATSVPYQACLSF